MLRFILIIFVIQLVVVDLSDAESLPLRVSKSFGNGKSFNLTLDGETFTGHPETRDCSYAPEICFSTRDGEIVLESGTLHSDDRSEVVRYSFASFNNKTKGFRTFYGGIWFTHRRVSISGVSKGEQSKFKAISLDMETPPGYGCESDGDSSTRAFSRNITARSNHSSNPFINVLVAYTPEVKKNVGGTIDGVYAMVAFKFLELRKAILNSKIDARFKIAGIPHALRPANVFSGAGAGAALVKGDGIYDELHSLKKSRKADLVHVFNTGTSGSGFIPHGPLPEDPLPALGRFGFSSSVVGQLYFYGATIFQHEIGHNLGAGHDAASAPEGYDPDLLGFEPTSHGHRFVGNSGQAYATIMAYTEPGETRINHFSSPVVTYEGVATGNESANNAATIESLVPMVKAYSDNIEYPTNQNLKINLRRYPDDPQTYFYVERSGPKQAVLARERLQVIFDPGGGFKSTAAESEFGAESFEVPLEGSGSYYAHMYPDIYVRSDTIKVPNLFQGVIEAKAVGSHITGTIEINSKPAKRIPGDWLTIAKLDQNTGEFLPAGYATVEYSGSFKTPALASGIYRLQYNYINPIDKTSIVLIKSSQVTI